MSRRTFCGATARLLGLLFICLLRLHAPLPCYSAPSPDFTLETKWELTLNGNFMSFSFAVCPDGTLYAVHDGKVEAVSAEGRVIGRESQVEAGVHPVACDDEHKLFVAGRALSIYQTDLQGNLNRISSAELKVPVLGIVVAPDNSIYGMTDEETPAIVLILPSGKEIGLDKEARPRTAILPHAPEITPHSCDMVWDSSRNRVGYTLPGESQIRFLENPRTNSKQSYGTDSYEPSANSCGMFGWRQLVALPNGEFARMQIENSEIARVFSKQYFEVLDPGLKSLGRLPVETGDFLIGATKDGSLYFGSYRGNDKNAVTISKRLLRAN